MKRIPIKAITFFTFLLICVTALTSCHHGSKMATSSATGSDAKWFAERSWLKGLELKPHSSVNQAEFSRQYHLSPVWWDKAFNYLRSTDLATIAPGVYIIDSGNVFATITEHNPKEKDQVNWEAHRNFNDLQYVISGKVTMGVMPFGSPAATVSTPYSDKSDTENYTITEPATYYDAEPGTFFIFSPKEMHRPGIKVTGVDLIRKIVIKVRVPK